MQYKAEYKEYKTEPVTPGLHPEPYSYPGVPFTPSPSSSGCESPGIEHKSPGTVHKSPGTLHNSPGTVQKSPGTVHKSPGTVHKSSSSIYQSPGTTRT